MAKARKICGITHAAGKKTPANKFAGAAYRNILAFGYYETGLVTSVPSSFLNTKNDAVPTPTATPTKTPHG